MFDIPELQELVILRKDNDQPLSVNYNALAVVTAYELQKEMDRNEKNNIDNQKQIQELFKIITVLKKEIEALKKHR